MGLEARAVDEDVGVLGLTGPAGPGRPGTAEPQAWVVLDEPGGDGALPGPTGAEEDEDP